MAKLFSHDGGNIGVHLIRCAEHRRLAEAKHSQAVRTFLFSDEAWLELGQQDDPGREILLEVTTIDLIPLDAIIRHLREEADIQCAAEETKTNLHENKEEEEQQCRDQTENDFLFQWKQG